MEINKEIEIDYSLLDSPDMAEENMKLAEALIEEYMRCPECEDTGEVVKWVTDGEGNWIVDGTEPCSCKEDYEPNDQDR